MAAYPGVLGCTKGLPPALTLTWLVENFIGSEKELRKKVEQGPRFPLCSYPLYSHGFNSQIPCFLTWRQWLGMHQRCSISMN